MSVKLAYVRLLTHQAAVTLSFSTSCRGGYLSCTRTHKNRLQAQYALFCHQAVYIKRQEGSLCAQHCLNALLQNQYFSAVDLAQIGRRLDERERDRMAEGGVASNEYQRFIEEPSINFDDSGFFSVQVITEALSVWGLDMVLYNSQNPIAVQARADPTKLGHQWFNLNSLLSGPELISDTYLSLFLTQLQQEGYSIFIVTGALPECEADQLLKLMPAVQTVKPRLLTEKEEGGEGTADRDEDADGALMEALRASRELIDNDDAALQQALQMSMEAYHSNPTASSSEGGQSSSAVGEKSSVSQNSDSPASSDNSHVPSQQELREKRLAFLNKQATGSGGAAETCSDTTRDTGQKSGSAEPTEEELLAKAIAMSMENS